VALLSVLCWWPEAKVPAASTARSSLESGWQLPLLLFAVAGFVRQLPSTG
jgi:hypothetical protein